MSHDTGVRATTALVPGSTAGDAAQVLGPTKVDGSCNTRVALDHVDIDTTISGHSDKDPTLLRQCRPG